MSELDTFVAAVLDGDLDAAGALADWLDEHDDPRGVLLRRRWKRWQSDRRKAEAKDRVTEQVVSQPWIDLVEKLRAAGMDTAECKILVSGQAYAGNCDLSFRGYIQERFPKGLSLKVLT
jgi:hypothetical protein